MEKCTWRCKHLQCSKLCSEPCDRELCEHPSTKLIKKCRHPSIGICGENVPRFCRICDEDKVKEIFFGNEDEEDARFIELEDCNHVIEVHGLIYWMNDKPQPDENNPNSANNGNSIQLKTCPKCKTVIRHTKSLNTFMQASLSDIQQVKLKTCGDPEENRMNQHILFEKVEEVLKDEESFANDLLNLRSIYKDIMISTKPKPGFAKPNQKLIELNNKFELVLRLKEVSSVFQKREKPHQSICAETAATFESRLRMAALFVKDYKNSAQQRADISTEMSFLQLMADVIDKASKQPFNDTGKQLLKDAFKFANRYGAATERVRKEFQAMVAEASNHSTGIGISIEEKQMILKAMDFKRGHWYKCPNGHIYAIGECGGAMQRSKCPECGQTIGGASHTLEHGNTLATEMDGATYPAWPTAFNRQY